MMITQNCKLSFTTRTLLVLIGIIALAVGCGGEDEPGNCLLVKNNATYKDGSLEEFTYTYNANGKLMKTSSVVTSQTRSSSPYYVEYMYAANGNMIQMAFPDAKTIYTYDSDNQLSRRSITATTYGSQLLKVNITLRARLSNASTI